MPHAIGKQGPGAGPGFSLQSLLSRKWEVLAPLLLFPIAPGSQFPDPFQNSRIGQVKRQTHTKTGFPRVVRRVIFILFPFGL